MGVFMGFDGDLIGIYMMGFDSDFMGSLPANMVIESDLIRTCHVFITCIQFSLKHDFSW